MSILNYIERIKRENEGPRITAQEPRNMAQGGEVIGKPGGIVEPGVMYYGKKVKDMTSEERFLQNAQSAARKAGVSGKKAAQNLKNLKKYTGLKNTKRKNGVK